MEKINKTPIRTCEHYKINDFTIDKSYFEKEADEFCNFSHEGIYLYEINDTFSLKYGLGNEALKQVNENHNLKLMICPFDKHSKIMFNLDESHHILIDDLTLKLERDTELVIDYRSKNLKECYHNGVIRINALDNVKAVVTIINNLNSDSINMLAIDSQIGNNANVVVNIVDFGGKLSISNYYGLLSGEGSINNLNTIYMGAGNQVFDVNYIVDILGKNNNVNIDVEGALKDASKKSFKGTIDFKKGCKKSVGSEEDYCLIFSKDARSKSLPMLLASEEDVVGNHASATGKIDDKMLFYIESRGLSKADAEKLVVRSRFNNVLGSISDEKTKDYINSLIDEKM